MEELRKCFKINFVAKISVDGALHLKSLKNIGVKILWPISLKCLALRKTFLFYGCKKIVKDIKQFVIS